MIRKQVLQFMLVCLSLLTTNSIDTNDSAKSECNFVKLLYCGFDMFL